MFDGFPNPSMVDAFEKNIDNELIIANQQKISIQFAKLIIKIDNICSKIDLFE